MIAGPGRSWSNPRAAFATCAPESANDHFVFIECVIEVGAESPEVYTTNARNRRLRVGRSRTRKRSDDPERLLDSSTRAKFAKDDFCVEEPSGLDVLVRILERLMERGSVVLVEPTTLIPGTMAAFMALRSRGSCLSG
jgi:hypothetical protein